MLFQPLILLLIGGGALFINLKRRRQRVAEVPLTAEDLERAEKLLSDQAGEEPKT